MIWVWVRKIDLWWGSSLVMSKKFENWELLLNLESKTVRRCVCKKCVKKWEIVCVEFYVWGSVGLCYTYMYVWYFCCCVIVVEIWDDNAAQVLYACWRKRAVGWTSWFLWTFLTTITIFINSNQNLHDWCRCESVHVARRNWSCPYSTQRRMEVCTKCVGIVWRDR